MQERRIFMARNRIFEPVIFTLLRTDGNNHADDIEFKVSYGYELKNYEHPVFKVQMVGAGYIKGRQAPTYSDDDFDKIIQIRNILKEKFYNYSPEIRVNLRDIEVSMSEIEQTIQINNQ